MQLFKDLTDKTPIHRWRHRLSKHEWELVDKRCKELHETSFIQPSSSNFAAAIIMLAKNIQLDYGSRKKCVGIIGL
jgi:hypothetical protein